MGTTGAGEKCDWQGEDVDLVSLKEHMHSNYPAWVLGFCYAWAFIFFSQQCRRFLDMSIHALEMPEKEGDAALESITG